MDCQNSNSKEGLYKEDICRNLFWYNIIYEFRYMLRNPPKNQLDMIFILSS